jgi:hypothetical protein
VPTALKRKGSMLMDYHNTARQNNRFTAPSIVLIPAHETDLRSKNKTGMEDLRIAMELDEAQFQQLIVSTAHITFPVRGFYSTPRTSCPYAIWQVACWILITYGRIATSGINS